MPITIGAEQITALAANGTVLLAIFFTIARFYGKPRKVFLNHILIIVANSVLQAASIRCAFNSIYLVVYIASFISQVMFLAANWQSVRILDMFKFLSPKVTPTRIRALRICSMILFLVNEIIMIIGLPFVLAGTTGERPGSLVIMALRVFVIVHVLAITILTFSVAVWVTMGIYRVTRGDSVLHSSNSLEAKAHKDLVSLKVNNVFKKTLFFLGANLTIYIFGIGSYIYYSLTNKLLFLYLAFAVIGAHSVSTIQILENFSKMITTHFKSSSASGTKGKGTQDAASKGNGMEQSEKTVVKWDKPNGKKTDATSSGATLQQGTATIDNRDNNDSFSNNKTWMGNRTILG
jgi:hypothetical protein